MYVDVCAALVSICSLCITQEVMDSFLIFIEHCNAHFTKHTYLCTNKHSYNYSCMYNLERVVHGTCVALIQRLTTRVYIRLCFHCLRIKSFVLSTKCSTVSAPPPPPPALTTTLLLNQIKVGSERPPISTYTQKLRPGDLLVGQTVEVDAVAFIVTQIKGAVYGG